MRKKLNKFINRMRISSLEKQPKVFCISMQRTGTTSTGQFFKDHGLRWSGWGSDKRNNWSQLWALCDYESIFASEEFRLANAYEDSPWWYSKFYEELYKRFPDAKFILLKRDPSKWYKSVLSRAQDGVMGAVNTHCMNYAREAELNQLIEAGTPQKQLTSVSGEKPMSMKNMEEHYTTCYLEHFDNATEFFNKNQPDALYAGELEDPKKWQKIGHFLGIDVADDYESHKNDGH
ncbi:MAG: hypothetical protein KJO21_05895 [Verrucomicrobiae bacterium]|nr:hypothetical protein [Verrucomicrobiae bacterium]NNJ43708.1 hypothetical protein [Akkermansiaceae bacterium]